MVAAGAAETRAPAVGARPPVAAAGTLDRAPASPAYRAWLAVELVVLFGLAPLLMVEVIHGRLFAETLGALSPNGRVGLFVALLPVLVGIVVLLLADPRFSLVREVSRAPRWRTIGAVLLTFLVLGGAVTWYMATYHPRLYLEFPTRRFDVWLRVMILYPLMSVIVQELVFRTFFFHRYGPLFGGAILPAVAVNGAAFGYAHIVMGNWFAIWTTGLLGVLLAWRYATTRSFWAVSLEHALWGGLVFTVGLGRWYFTGVAS